MQYPQKQGSIYWKARERTAHSLLRQKGGLARVHVTIEYQKALQITLRKSDFYLAPKEANEIFCVKVWNGQDIAITPSLWGHWGEWVGGVKNQRQVNHPGKIGNWDKNKEGLNGGAAQGQCDRLPGGQEWHREQDKWPCCKLCIYSASRASKSNHKPAAWREAENIKLGASLSVSDLTAVYTLKLSSMYKPQEMTSGVLFFYRSV